MSGPDGAGEGDHDDGAEKSGGEETGKKRPLPGCEVGAKQRRHGFVAWPGPGGFESLELSETGVDVEDGGAVEDGWDLIGIGLDGVVWWI
jgi:hypothetical protein